MILNFLATETLRYGELKRRIPGVSHKMLTQQLKELHSDGLVERIDHGETPPRVDYALSPLGKSLATAICSISSWSDQHADEIDAIIARRAAS